jgi:hypothetical protein
MTTRKHILGKLLKYLCITPFFVVAIPAFAINITFDDLDGSGNNLVPNGYKGFNWTNFYTYDAVNDPAHLNPSGYQFAAVSPNNVAFLGFGNPAFVSNTLFNLGSAYLTSIWRDNLQIEVIGSLSGVPIYDNIYTLSATGHTLLNFNYHGIDSVEFSIFDGGTHHQGYEAFDGTQVAFDNLTLSVPDSASTVMLFSIGVCALGFLRRKLAWIDRLAGAVNRRFEFHKRSQLFLLAHNETLSVAAMSVGNENRSPFGIHGWDATPTPSGFAELVHISG